MKPKRIIIGYIDVANCITLLGLMFSLSSCFFALNGNLKISITFLIASSICDLFDGAIAQKIKRVDEEKKFGVQLDTISDMISFGITPAIIVFSASGMAWYALLIYAFYIMCAVVRLAYFNAIIKPDVPLKHYRGLPVPCIAWILPIVLLFGSRAANITTLALVGVLFILNIKIPKLCGFWYILFSIIDVILIILWWCL